MTNSSNTNSSNNTNSCNNTKFVSTWNLDDELLFDEDANGIEFKAKYLMLPTLVSEDDEILIHATLSKSITNICFSLTFEEIIGSSAIIGKYLKFVNKFQSIIDEDVFARLMTTVDENRVEIRCRFAVGDLLLMTEPDKWVFKGRGELVEVVEVEDTATVFKCAVDGYQNMKIEHKRLRHTRDCKHLEIGSNTELKNSKGWISDRTNLLKVQNAGNDDNIPLMIAMYETNRCRIFELYYNNRLNLSRQVCADIGIRLSHKFVSKKLQYKNTGKIRFVTMDITKEQWNIDLKVYLVKYCGMAFSGSTHMTTKKMTAENLMKFMPVIEHDFSTYSMRCEAYAITFNQNSETIRFKANVWRYNKRFDMSIGLLSHRAS